jgi:hypothetical protein
MRDLNELNRYRLCSPEVAKMFGTYGDGSCGCFQVDSPTDSRPLFIIASSGLGWDHVSISHRSRCPNWPEMEHVKRLFFLPDEVAMQLHVAVADHISHAEHCLHLWRPHYAAIPLPPPELVGAPPSTTPRSDR